MPYNPGVSFDPRPLYQGISDIGTGIANGILQRRKNEEEKQKKASALAFARRIMPSINPEMANVADKDLAAGIEGVGIDNVLNLANSITQAKRQKENDDLQRQRIEQQMAADRAQQAAAARDQAALQGAINPQQSIAQRILGGPSYPRDIQQDYIKAGGSNAQHMNQLGDMAARYAKSGAKRATPQLMDLGNGVRGVWDGNNFSRVPDPKEQPPAAQTATVGGRALTTFGGKVFDDKGAIVGAEKPMEPLMGQVLLSNYQATVARIQGHKKGFWEGEGEAAARLSAEQEKANYQADQLGFARPFPAAGTAPEKAEPSGRAQPAPANGTRVKQGGITYEYDGKNYNPVN